jgi:hypothetical protein
MAAKKPAKPAKGKKPSGPPNSGAKGKVPGEKGKPFGKGADAGKPKAGAKKPPKKK